MCIREGNEWKTLFKISYNPLYVVMPFGFTNAPTIFQHVMNDVFCEYLDDFMVYYIDNVLNFLENIEDHECHVCMVLEKL